MGMECTMKYSIILFICLTFVPCAAFGNEFSEDEFCSQITEMAEKLNAEGSSMVDAGTRQDGMAAICSLKVVEFKKFVNMPITSLREGWQGRKQAQWNKIYCDNNSPFRSAIDNGWTIGVLTTFIDGEQHRIKAACN
jgi:hypothetical protein